MQRKPEVSSVSLHVRKPSILSASDKSRKPEMSSVSLHVRKPSLLNASKKRRKPEILNVHNSAKFKEKREKYSEQNN